MPRRIQLSRRKGWRMPDNTRSVARPTRWGNPFRVGMTRSEVSDVFFAERATPVVTFRMLLVLESMPPDIRLDAARAVELYKAWLTETESGLAIAWEASRELRGKNLACWCPLGEPCHADALLDLINPEGGE